MDQGGDGLQLAGQLHEAGALPAAQLKYLVHQKAGREVAALPGEAVAQRLTGGGVGPDKVGGGVVLPEAGELRQVEAGPNLGVPRIAVAHPGLVVPKKDQHKGLGPGVQLPGQPLHGGQGAGDIGHIVVEHVAGLRRPAGVARGQEDLLGGGGLIGTVVLIADGEGEPGARFPQSASRRSASRHPPGPPAPRSSSR